jgi:hypothetical protein
MLVTGIYWLCVGDCDVLDMNDKHVPLSRMSVGEHVAATNSLLADRVNRWEPRWIGVIAATALSALFPVTAVRADAEASTRTGAGSTPRDPNGPIDGCKKGSEDQGFGSRLKDSYTSHLEWNGGDPTAPPAMIVGGTEVPESWVGDVIELRPDLRYDHARDAEAYDNPTQAAGAGRNSQVMFAADAIFHF